MSNEPVAAEGTWRDGRGQPWRWRLEMEEIGGLLRPVGLEVRPAGDNRTVLTQSVLREFPLGRVVRRALTPGADLFRTDQPFRSADELVDPTYRTSADEVRALNARALRQRVKGLTVAQRKALRERAKLFQQSMTPHRGGSPPRGTRYYQRVAEVYLTAQGSGQPPLQSVMRQFGLKKSTAATHVGRARRMGLIPPYEGGEK